MGKRILLMAVFLGTLAIPLHAAIAATHSEGEYAAQMSSENEGALSGLEILAKPLGLATLLLVLLTATLGLSISRSPVLVFKWHRRSALTTVAMAICHGIVVFLTH